TPKNWYTDEVIIEAQLLLAHRVAARLREKRAIWAYDLGNENSNCVVPPSREAAIRWLEAISSEIRSVDRQRAITIGLHMEDLEEDRNLGPAEAARVSDFLSMHGYPMYAPWAHGPTDEMLLPFLGAITRWLSGAPNLDVLFEEFGAPTVHDAGMRAGIVRRLDAPPRPTAKGVPVLQEEEARLFTCRALNELHQFGFLGAMLWCYGDYGARLWSRPPLDLAPHERSFGLWRSDHSPKPAVATVQRLTGADRRPWQDGYGWINVKPSEFYGSPRENIRNLYLRFRTLGTWVIP
ncbi:MAG: hypothetical protein ACREAC_27410, partial [Blastocatellia bacterium]